MGIYKHLPKQLEMDGNKTTLLNSHLQVANEGTKMRHCVVLYGDRCASGNYVVYHLVLKDGTEGTLGCVVLSIAEKELMGDTYSVAYQQCYGYCNERIDTTFARSVINTINSRPSVQGLTITGSINHE